MSWYVRTPVSVAALVLLAACTPQASLVMSLLPDGTVPVLLSHFERVDDTNRKRIAELEQRRDWEGLAKFADENLKRDPLNDDWWIVAGYARSQQGDAKRAVEAYAEAVRLAPDDLLAWNLLAQAQRAAGDTPRALQTLNRALLVRRDSAPTWLLLGTIHAEQGRHADAVNAFREAVRLDERSTPAWVGLGKSYAKLGKTAEAEQVSRTLEKLDPAAAAQLR